MFALIEEYDVQATRKEAKQEGIKEGIKEGVQKGIKESSKEKSIDVARKLLKLGDSMEKVKIVVELTDEEIEQIKQYM